MAQSSQPVLQVAAKAVIMNDKGKVLLVRESATGPNNTQVGLWGLPGGRLEPGESFFDGLRREALEETGLQVTPIKPIYVGEWRPMIRGQKHQIVAIFILCAADNTQISVSQEHDEFMWILPKDRHNYQLMDPDHEVIDAILDI